MSHSPSPASPCSTIGAPTTARPSRLIRVDHGRPTAYLPLRCGGFAVLDGIDADRLTAAGIDLSGAHLATLRDSAPAVVLPSVVPHRYPVLILARLILGAAPGQRVDFRNGDRTDLRRDNIRLRARKAGSRTVREVR
ncbi:MAG: hypothetical protein HEQ37_18755 [Acidovorax sp.]|nr:hypothetical protein [Acidovorax sp.]